MMTNTNKKMTKAQMVEVIGKSGMVIGFDSKYMMRRDKNYVTAMYEKALQYMKRYNIVLED